MNLESLFCALCKYTTPHGTEGYCIPYLPEDHYLDSRGNVHVHVPKPDGTVSKTMFSSHLDTADSRMERVHIRIDEERVITSDGTTILGADCKIGVALMCMMIDAGVPGWYAFHAGEEVGMVGSGAMAEEMEGWDPAGIPSRCIAFDRKGTTSIITHQQGTRTCSDSFAAALGPQLLPGYRADPEGIFTDSFAYRGLIPECTNLSVGYQGQHTDSESQDMAFAERLLAKLLLVDWENLPTERDPAIPEARDVPYASWHYGPTDEGCWMPSAPGLRGRTRGVNASVPLDWDEEPDDKWSEYKEMSSSAATLTEQRDAHLFVHTCEHCGVEDYYDIDVSRAMCPTCNHETDLNYGFSY